MSRLSIAISMVVGLVMDLIGVVVSGAIIRDATEDLAVLSRRKPTPIRDIFARRDVRDALVFLLGIMGSLLIDALFLWGAVTAHISLEGLGGYILILIMVVVPSAFTVNMILKFRERRRLKRMARDLVKESD